MYLTLHLLLILLYQIQLSLSSQNSVIGLPIISCEDDVIRVELQTAHPYKGKLYVKGEHTNKECIRDYTNGIPIEEYDTFTPINRSQKWNVEEGKIGRFPDSEGYCPPCECNDKRRKRESSNIIQMTIPLDQCNMQRDRIASPPSIRLSFVAVVSFHQSFITKLDRAYRVQCIYGESNRIISAKFDVQMQKALNLSRSVEPISCDYRIKGKNNELIRNVQVGEIVRHEWSCTASDPDIYSLLIHDCSVEDGNGERRRVIDERGCSLDDYVLGNPIYSSSSLSASLDAYVFKFPDRSIMDFQCSISLCMKNGDIECSTITPPDCSLSSSSRKRRSIHSSSLSTWTLHSSRLNILDSDSSIPSHHSSIDSSSSYLPSSLCFSISTFSFLVSIISCVATSSIIIIIMTYKSTK